MHKQQTAFYKNVDWILLLFLAGATYTKLYIKVAAIILYFLYMVFRKYEFKNPISVNNFYFLILLAGTISSVLQGAFASPEYIYGYTLGSFTWLIGGIISYFTFVSVVNLNEIKLHQTIKAFFLLNAFVCFADFIGLVIESKHLMPYWYWDAAERFGSSTGDHVKGIFSNNSITNAMINVLGVIYFSYRKELKMALLCLFICQMCTSNFTILTLIILLVAVILLAKDKKIKINSLFLLLFTVVIYPILSPLNVTYIGTTYSQSVDESKTISYRKIDTAQLRRQLPAADRENELESGLRNYIITSQKANYFHLKTNGKDFIDFKDDLKYIQYYKKANTAKGSNVALKQSFLKSTIEKWYAVKYELTPLNTYYRPIKLYSFIQTLFYMKSGLYNMIFGAGIGNFSSKLAIKMTGLNMQGTYPLKNIYVSQTFVEYHLYTLFYVFSLPPSEHSIVNMPNSIYNQIGGEYGLIGIFLFIFLYLGFFWRNRQKLTYGIVLALLALLCFTLDYWFEMLTFTVIFELLMFKNIFKEENVLEQP